MVIKSELTSGQHLTTSTLIDILTKQITTKIFEKSSKTKIVANVGKSSQERKICHSNAGESSLKREMFYSPAERILPTKRVETTGQRIGTKWVAIIDMRCHSVANYEQNGIMRTDP